MISHSGLIKRQCHFDSSCKLSQRLIVTNNVLHEAVIKSSTSQQFSLLGQFQKAITEIAAKHDYVSPVRCYFLKRMWVDVKQRLRGHQLIVQAGLETVVVLIPNNNHFIDPTQQSFHIFVDICSGSYLLIIL